MSILKSTRLCYTLNGILLHTGLPQVVLSGCSDNVIIFKEFAPSTLPHPVFLLLFKAPVRSHENQCKISNLRKYCQRPVRHLAESLTFTCILIKFCCFLCFQIFDTRSAEKEPNIRIVWGWSSSCYYEGGKWYLENHQSRKLFTQLEISKSLWWVTKPWIGIPKRMFFFSLMRSLSLGLSNKNLYISASLGLACVAAALPEKKLERLRSLQSILSGRAAVTQASLGFHPYYSCRGNYKTFLAIVYFLQLLVNVTKTKQAWGNSTQMIQSQQCTLQ